MTLVDEIQGARWFGGKSRTIASVRVVDRVRWVADAELRLVEVEYADGPAETYVLAERLDEASIALGVLHQFLGADIVTEAGGSLFFRPGRLFDAARTEPVEPVVPVRGEQSNTSVRFGNSLMLKLYRRVQFGPNPDVEVGRFLTEHTGFTGTPAVVGSLDYLSPTGGVASLAMLQRFVHNRGDAWTTTLRRLQGILDGAPFTESVEAIARLGETTAALHLALASGSDEFSADRIDASDLETWKDAIEAEVHLAVEALARRQIAVDPEQLLSRAGGIVALDGAQKTRHHGDYHLGQVLQRDDGAFVIIDFEGEPSKPLPLRRAKHSPLRDVAGMLRSLDYARHAALRSRARVDDAQVERLAGWHDATRQSFLTSYLDTLRREMPSLVPADVSAPLAALELQKAAYEVLYELNNRPDWLAIPLAALQTTDALSSDVLAD